MQFIALNFYLGYQKQPWFVPAGSENTCIFTCINLNAFVFVKFEYTITNLLPYGKTSCFKVLSLEFFCANIKSEMVKNMDALSQK